MKIFQLSLGDLQKHFSYRKPHRVASSVSLIPVHYKVRYFVPPCDPLLECTVTASPEVMGALKHGLTLWITQAKVNSACHYCLNAFVRITARLTTISTQHERM